MPFSDMKVSLPFFACPTAGNRMFHTEGELATANVKILTPLKAQIDRHTQTGRQRQTNTKKNNSNTKSIYFI